MVFVPGGGAGGWGAWFVAVLGVWGVMPLDDWHAAGGVGLCSALVVVCVVFENCIVDASIFFILHAAMLRGGVLCFLFI